jgi:hypothetical protein
VLFLDQTDFFGGRFRNLGRIMSEHDAEEHSNTYHKAKFYVEPELMLQYGT